jgi:hypothetical protein
MIAVDAVVSVTIIDMVKVAVNTQHSLGLNNLLLHAFWRL